MGSFGPNLTVGLSLQQARPTFKLAHSGDDADTNFIMMVDRGPSKADLTSDLLFLCYSLFCVQYTMISTQYVCT